jgi:hypothetical protein
MLSKIWLLVVPCSIVCALLAQVASGGIDCTSACGKRVRWQEDTTVFRKYNSAICFRTGVVDPAGGTVAKMCVQDSEFNMTSKERCNAVGVCNGAHDAEEASIAEPEDCENDGTIIRRDCTEMITY